MRKVTLDRQQLVNLASNRAATDAFPFLGQLKRVASVRMCCGNPAAKQELKNEIESIKMSIISLGPDQKATLKRILGVEQINIVRKTRDGIQTITI